MQITEEQLAEINKAIGLAEKTIIAMADELMKYRTALADAIRRPMGVIPDSADGLVDQQDLDDAEKRRAQI